MGVVIFLIFAVVAALAFYTALYRKFDYNAKIVCKAIIIYLGLGITALSIMLVIVGVKAVAEQERDKQLPSRLKSIEYYAAGNDYVWMVDFMEMDMDYEEEFECYWERAIMHEMMLRYRIYQAAAEAELGEEFDAEAVKYEQLMRKYCEEPIYAQNIPYGEYFMELSGYIEE